MAENPILMEQYFDPGFKAKPAVHVGSQTMRFFWGDPKEQAFEGRHLAAAGPEDLVVVRSIDQGYLDYWNSLMGEIRVLKMSDVPTGEFLSQTLLDRPDYLNWIKKNSASNSNLAVFLPTQLEAELAAALDFPLHGTPEVSDFYGTKSGIRSLASEVGIPMSRGFICSTYQEAEQAVIALSEDFEFAALKHDLSTGGGWSKKISNHDLLNLPSSLDEVSGGQFKEDRDILVIEGWLKSKASLCAHIEIMESGDPIICAGWEQAMAGDGITYMGAGPLTISEKALQSFMEETKKLAYALKEKGAVGSYAPDFLIVADDETNFEPDNAVMIELNARIPATAFPLEIVKQVRGEVGNSFLARHFKMPLGLNFTQVSDLLKEHCLLIESKDSQASGVVPYNSGLLPWGTLDIVAMAPTWEETCRVSQRLGNLFK